MSMTDDNVIVTEDNLRVVFDDVGGFALAEALLAGEVVAAVTDLNRTAEAGDELAQLQATKVLLELLGRLMKPKRNVVLQNRDRSTPAMIAQMTQIASAPDYYRVAPTKEFASGTPIVFGNDDALPANIAMGRKDKAVAADGRRFQVQYAVVEAADLLTSNTADGLAVADYTNGAPGKLRAIAGNGRLAGLKAGFERGTAGDYVQELTEDDAHGIAADDIAKFTAPILVRIMRAEDVTENIGDISNQKGTSDLSPVEQAQNDSKRLDLADLDVSDDGKPTESAALAFIAAMPEAERNNLMDGKHPGQKAYDRLMAAVFWKAYADPELVRLYAQSVDSEIKTIMGGMASAAGELARLDGAGELDIRAVVTEAASLAVNAKRQGVKLAEFAKQTDMTLSPDTMEVVRMFAENIRSAKKIGERLRATARFAYEEFTKEDTDMFGAVEKATREQVLARLSQEPESSLFDAVDPLLALQLTGQLVAKTATLKASEEDPLAALALSSEILGIIRQLTEEAAAAPAADPAPAVDPLASARARIEGQDFSNLTRDFMRSLSVIKGLDDGTERGWDRALFVNSITGKMKTQAKNDPELAGILLAWLAIAQSKFAKPAITPRNSMWQLVEGWSQYKPLFRDEEAEPMPAPKLQFAQSGPYTGFLHNGKVVTENQGYYPLDGWKLYSDEDAAAFKSAPRGTNAGAVGATMRAMEANPQKYIDAAENLLAAATTPIDYAANNGLPAPDADPFAYEAWLLEPAKIQTLPAEQYAGILAKLTAENYHTEALVMRAAREGTAAQYEEAMSILTDYSEAGSITPDLRVRSDALSAALNGMAAPAAEPEPVTPEPNEPSMETLIKIAADSIDQLRRIDVYRVLESAGARRAALADYIVANRPDLLKEVSDVMAEEFADLGWTATPATTSDTPPASTNGVPGDVAPVNPERTADMEYLRSVAAKSVDMWDDDLADKLEAIVAKYPGDADLEAAWREAVNAYTNFMVENIAKAA